MAFLRSLPVVSKIWPRCHPRTTIRSYLLTPSFPAKAALGSQSPGGAALRVLPREEQEGGSSGVLHLPAAPAPPRPAPRPVQRRVVGAGAGQGRGAGSRRLPLSPRATLVWKVGAGVGTSGLPGFSAAQSLAGCGTMSLGQPPSALRSEGERAPRGPPRVSSLLPSPNGGGEG